MLGMLVDSYWTRAKIFFPISQTRDYIMDLVGTAQFLINCTLTHNFPHLHASMPASEHPPGEGSCVSACLISDCTVVILVHNVLFIKQIKMNESKPYANRITSCTFTAGVFLLCSERFAYAGFLGIECA